MDEGGIKVRFLVGRFLILTLVLFGLIAGVLLAVVKVDERVYGDGYVTARDDQDIRAFADGVIASIEVRDGDDVEEGQVVARLEDTAVRSRLDRQREALAKAESELAVASQRRVKLANNPLPDNLRFTRIDRDQAELSLKLAESEYQTARELHGEGLVSTQELERLKTKFEMAKKDLEVAESNVAMVEAGLTDVILEEAAKAEEVAQRTVEAARAEVHRLEKELERHTICSPVAGKVIWSRLKGGEAIGVGDRIATIQTSDRLEFRAFVPDAGVAKIAPGQTAILYSNAYSYSKFGLAYGEVVTVSSSGEPQDGGTVYLVRIEVTESPKPLPLGSRGQARIVIRERSVLQMLLGIGGE